MVLMLLKKNLKSGEIYSDLSKLCRWISFCGLNKDNEVRFYKEIKGFLWHLLLFSRNLATPRGITLMLIF